jgi:heat-inducible transcriptional repressor
LTKNVGIAAAIPTATQTLDRVELLSVPDRRVLMIVVTRDRMVRDRLVMLDEAVSQDELNSIRNYINENFGGWVFSDIEAELRRRLEKESAVYDAILRKLAVFFGKGLLDLGLTPEVHMEGTSNLVGLDLHLTGEKMRELFRALEQKKKILQLLERFLERPNGEVGVQVGLGDVHPSMRQLSLIGICVSLPSGMSARIAVLGPMRMNYAKIISTVFHVGQTFRSLPS